VAADEPASYLTLEPGADVFSSDGERIGTVEHMERLPKPSANPAVMEHHGVEGSEGRLEHKLKRAWEIVSGRG